MAALTAGGYSRKLTERIAVGAGADRAKTGIQKDEMRSEPGSRAYRLAPSAQNRRSVTKMKIIAAITSIMLLCGCAILEKQPRMDMASFKTMESVARTIVLGKVSGLDNSLLQSQASSGSFDDDGRLLRYSSEFRMPPDTNGVFLFYRIELATTNAPPVVTFFSTGSGQVERVLQEIPIKTR